jgi:hypothetical protein
MKVAGNEKPKEEVIQKENPTPKPKPIEKTPAKVSNPSELWYFKLNMKVDTQIAWCGETVYYGGTPTTTP